MKFDVSEVEVIHPRRRLLIAGGLTALGIGTARDATARAATERPNAPREMQVHRVRELGLEIWVENQPPWRTELRGGSRPVFVAEAPDAYHPPAVFSYASWPKERVADEVFATLAKTAITRASQNFGLNAAASRALAVRSARYGVLVGHESEFVGTVQGLSMDVRIFVGQQGGRFPVVLTLYTQQGKIGYLAQHVRRAWGKVAYI